MHIVFGMAADGRAFPEHPGRGAGCVGGAVAGPSGLLDLLATDLGLSAPQNPPIVRIATWQRKLRLAEGARPRFWSASLRADPWSTARLLLAWRDGLVEAGWSPVLAVPPLRLSDLADAEACGPVLPRGRADLLREVCEALAAGERPRVELLELVDTLEFLPPPWRRLTGALSDAGVTVRPVGGFVPVDAASDLGRVQRFLRTGEPAEFEGDGSVAIIDADTDLMAAECVAEWLAGDPDEGRGTVVLVPSGDSHLVDQALRRRGLPALGLSPSSPHRGALQLLALAFATAWAPADPGKLMDILLLPRPPIGRWAAGLLASALAREPGIGGPTWTAAWTRIEELLRARRAAGDPVDVDATLATWRAWVDVGRFDPKAGMPASDALGICERVVGWALSSDAGARDPLLLCVVGAGRSLATALRALDHSPVTGHQIERMIDQALAEGLPDPAHLPQEGHLRAVADPGAIWAAAGRVVWWGFSGPARAQAPFPWDRRERAWLEAAGCCPELPETGLQREASHWQAAVLNAREALVLVRSATERGTETTSHPLAHRLAPILEPSMARISVPAERIVCAELASVAAREIVRRPAAPTSLPPPMPVWDLSPAWARRIEGRRESATSLSDLLDCQLRWLLKHVAGLRGEAGKSLPGPERLFGNLAHALAQAVFPVGAVPDPYAVRRQATAAFDTLVERIAAPLRLPGLAGELAFARRRIPDALATLASVLAAKGMAIEALEVDHQGTFDDLKVGSRIDIVVRAADGTSAVVDLKWTTSKGRHAEELASGRSIQLATYARLLEPTGGVPAGYFLLRQRRLLAEVGSPLSDDAIVVERTLDETWDAIVADWRILTDAARAGTGLSAGVPGVEAHLPPTLSFVPRDGVCRYCDLGRVCRMPPGGS